MEPTYLALHAARHGCSRHAGSVRPGGLEHGP